MSPAITKYLLDGTLEFSGGVDSGRSPAFVEQNQSSSAVNCSMRGGKLQPRPGLHKLALDFGNNAVLRNNFVSTKFQHGAFFDGTETPNLMMAAGGRQFKIDLNTLAVTDITPPMDPNSAIPDMGWSVQAENFWIYQDNRSYPVIYDGSSSRRSNPAKSEVPVGNVMAYSMGRLVVALPDRKSFRAGDIVFGDGNRSDMLAFTENNYLNEGGDFVARIFGAPSGYGPITSMRPLAMLDSQLGQGPLMIGTPNMVFTVNLPLDRTIWKNMASALQTVSPLLGPMGHNSTVMVNGDVWYRSVDGIRSFIQARRDFTTWGNTPMSTEVNNILSADSGMWLDYSSAVLFDNRLLMTCSPFRSDTGICHRGLVALDFNTISSMRGRAAPAWEGVWNGLNIRQIVKGTVDSVDHAYVFTLSDAGETEVWEVRPDKTTDQDDEPITWTCDLRSMNCQQGFALKRLESGELFLDNVKGSVSISVQYKPDQYPCFLPWDSTSVCSTVEDCGPSTDCGLPKQYQPQFRSKIRLHQPPDTKDTINRRRHRTAFEFQPRLEMAGYCHVKQFRLLTIAEPEATNAEREHL